MLYPPYNSHHPCSGPYLSSHGRPHFPDFLLLRRFLAFLLTGFNHLVLFCLCVKLLYMPMSPGASVVVVRVTVCAGRLVLILDSLEK